jgi:Protein of unknown function (DUF732)
MTMMARIGTALTCVVAAGVLHAAPAQADDSDYLNRIHDEYWSHSFTDSQLLAEGHKVCDAAGRMNDSSLESMARSDLGISSNAAETFVTVAHIYLGC